jgi:hypothetical protein
MGPLTVWPELSVDLYGMHGDFRHQVLFPRETVMAERRMLTTSLSLGRFDSKGARMRRLVARGKQRQHIRPLDEFDRAVSLAAYDSDHLGQPRKPLNAPHLLHTTFVCEQQPNPESRVTLSDDRDALGMPRPKLSWRLTGAETRSIFEMADIVARSVAAAGSGRLRMPTKPEDLQEVFWQGFHHMGTTRMHRDPKRGVVDPDCRVHGIDNLYVAGSSVFPTSGAANPTFTIVALTIRMADFLKRRFGAA